MANDYSERQEQILRDELAKVQARQRLAEADLRVLMGKAFRDPERNMARFKQQVSQNEQKTLKHFSTDGQGWMYAEGYGKFRGSRWSLSEDKRQERHEAVLAVRQIPATMAEI